MPVDQTMNAEVQRALARASDLMFEALILLDRAQTAHSAALLDHAIALLPACTLTAQIDGKLPKAAA